ncbi:hypothetical protein AAG906_027199 [Vitis piasezkii]
MSCSICQSFEHLVEECPTIPTVREMFGDQPNGTSVHATWPSTSQVMEDFVGDQKSINAQLSQRIDSVESTLNKRMDGMQNDLSQKIDNLQYSISRLTNLNTSKRNEMEAQEGKSSQVREVKVVITLRSGKEVDLPTSKPEHEPESKAEKEKREEIKGKRKGNSAKNEDLESNKALLDLGASVNLLPYSVYKQLGLGELKPTSMTLSLADRSVKIPRGMIEDWILLFLIRTRNGVMQLTFGNVTLELNIFYLCKKQFHPEEEEGPEEACMINNLSLGDLDEGLPEPSDLLATLPPWKMREEILSLFNGEETQEVVKRSPQSLFKPLPTKLEYAYLEENKRALLLFLYLLPLLRRIVYLKSSGDVKRR